MFPCRWFLDPVNPAFQSFDDELKLVHGAPFDFLRSDDPPDVCLNSLIAPVSDDSKIVHFIPEAFALPDLRVRRRAKARLSERRQCPNPFLAGKFLAEVVRPPVTLERSPRYSSSVIPRLRRPVWSALTSFLGSVGVCIFYPVNRVRAARPGSEPRDGHAEQSFCK